MLKRAASPLLNPALPSKIYGIWNGDKRLGQVTGDSPVTALSDGKKIWGSAARASIYEGVTNPSVPNFRFYADGDWRPGGGR